MPPKFSIIIPVYNVAPYLRECLDSVFAQTFTDWEAICVDDGSTDGSAAILDEYAAKDTRFRVIHQANAGVSAARNAALDVAQGEWIQFIDADDLYPNEEVLSVFYSEIGKTRSLAVGGGMEMFVTRGEAAKDISCPDFGGLYDFAKHPVFLGFTCYIFKLSMIRENNIRFVNLKQWEDPVFLVDVLSTAGIYHLMPKVVYSCRLPEFRGGIDWLSNDGDLLRDYLTGIDIALEKAKTLGNKKLYVDVACQLGMRGAFSAWSHIKIVNRNVRRFVREIKTSGFFFLRDWEKLTHRGFLGKEPFARKLFYYYRLFGLSILIQMLIGRVLNRWNRSR